MEQPKGFIADGQEHLVYQVKKSLYGLKQAPRWWYKKFNHFIQLVGIFNSDEDHYVFLKTTHTVFPIFLILYVDDMLVSHQHARELTDLIRKLQLKIAMKYLYPAWHILGMRLVGSVISENCFRLKPTTSNVCWSASTCNQPNLTLLPTTDI